MLPKSTQERAQLRSQVFRLLEAKRTAEQDQADAALRDEFAAEEAALKVAPWHGTLSGYMKHRCRCRHCLRARSDYYYKQKAKGKR